MKEIKAEPVPISSGQIDFQYAVEIEDSWILKFRDAVEIPDNGNESNSTQNETNNVIDIPFFGSIDVMETPLPVLTVIIGLADGFNPCAFFILTILLSALVYAQSRRRILIVGGIFVFFSGFIYFLFMSAWLNIFLLGTEITLLTFFAALVALTAGIINIKDYFFFKKGVSLTLPTSQKEKFMSRVNKLIKADSLVSLLIGTVILAATVNLYELLCTVGFPMVYTRVLTLQNISTFDYYLYLVFYNLMYVIPLAIIVTIFAVTLGPKKFTVEGVKNLKLVSGLIIFFLGLVLLLNPKLLENVSVTFSLLFSAVIVSGTIILLKKMLNKGKEQVSKKS